MNKDLIRLQTKEGLIKIAAFDHRDSLTKYVPQDKLSEFKTLCVETFAPYSTGILVDPESGLEAVKKSNEVGVSGIFSRELSGYTDTPQGRNTELNPNFPSKKLKELGAEAIKLLIYYNHTADNAEYQRNIVKQVKEEADEVNLPLLLEIITYPANTSIELTKLDLTKQAILDLRDYADILKLEYPFDPISRDFEADQDILLEISKLCSKPWVLLSRGGMDFETFKKAVVVCNRYGALGYAVGRAVWQDLKDIEKWEDKVNFIKTTAKQRMQELSTLI